MAQNSSIVVSQGMSFSNEQTFSMQNLPFVMPSFILNGVLLVLPSMTATNSSFTTIPSSHSSWLFFPIIFSSITLIPTIV